MGILLGMDTCYLRKKLKILQYGSKFIKSYHTFWFGPKLTSAFGGTLMYQLV